MKKLCAMILAAALCLGGCSPGVTGSGTAQPLKLSEGQVAFDDSFRLGGELAQFPYEDAKKELEQGGESQGDAVVEGIPLQVVYRTDPSLTTLANATYTGSLPEADYQKILDKLKAAYGEPLLQKDEEADGIRYLVYAWAANRDGSEPNPDGVADWEVFLHASSGGAGFDLEASFSRYTQEEKELLQQMRDQYKAAG